MSGGRLVSLDRLGRDAKAYILKQGLATIGSDSVCDIRILLPTVGLHHATVTVHANQTVVRSVSAGDTLVNGTAVSVAALRHRDIITIGDRSFRWQYDDPNKPRPLEPKPALVRRPTRSRTRRRVTMPASRTVIVPPHRDSMPSSSSGKQVAIVQPQRRTVNNDLNVSSSSSKRQRANRNDEEDSIEDADSSKRKSTGRNSPKVNLQDTTKATLWIESRKTPRKPTNLRLAVLRKTQSDKSLRVTKIQAPHQIDHTKQAAIMLMTGHTPKSKQPTPKRPTFVITKQTPVRKSTNRNSQSPPKSVGRKSIGMTPKRASTYSSRSSTGTSTDTVSTRTMTLQNSEINDSDVSTRRSTSRRSVRNTYKSSISPSPKKSALKDPSTKKSANKTESIKFDLSNLNDGDKSSDLLLVTSATSNTTNSDDLSLRYDESPLPRRSIHSRSSKILQKSLENSQSSFMKDSSLEKISLAPEAYSIVDLVSVDTYESSSEYNSAGSNNSSALPYNTPHTTARRKTRSNMLGSSTPYNNKTSQPVPSPNISQTTIESRITTRRSASMTTPENTHKNITFNSTRISKIRSRSRINDSDVLLVDDDESPRSSRRNKSNMSSPMPKNISIIEDAADITNGYVTPENRRSPTEATTPVLNMQSLLDQSTLTHRSSTLRQSPLKTKRNSKRKTIANVIRDKKKPKLSVKSQSLNFSNRRSLKPKSSTNSDEDVHQNDEEVVTPTSAVKLVLEGVKNKHSTAKKTTSKRDIIDNLNNSVIIKQLFNSPVKRKLSRSMTEFSRKKLFEEDNVSLRSKRNTIAAITTTPDSSLVNYTEAFTSEVFISPVSTPGSSPKLSGIKRLFRKHSPDNDLRDVRGVKSLLGSPRTRRSLRNDLTDVAGVKQLFARSPINRLSDVRVKEVFASSPNNDLRRVSGVKSLFRSTRQPKNTLEDVRGVKNLFINSPRNDLRNVSGVKQVLHVNSPANDLGEVRGVKQLYREQEVGNNLSDVSGVEELFNESTELSHLDSTFDQLMGKPRVHRSYTKCKSWTKIVKHQKLVRAAKSLQNSYSLITNNPEEWLENELKKRTKSNESTMPNKSVSKLNLTRELQRLTTNTIEGNTPLQASRARSSMKSASELYSARRLPIKKRSLIRIGDGSSRDGSGVTGSDRSRLPIKKRTLHSTPVKGMVNTTINTSMLRKVSPIAALDKTSYVTDIIPLIESPKSNQSKIQNKTRRGLPDILNTVDLLQPIPQTKRNLSEAQATPVQEAQVRVTRGPKTKETVVNGKKRRSLLVVPKKSPQFIPRSNIKEKKASIEIDKSSVKTRTTRRKSPAEEKKPQTSNTKSTRRKLPIEKKKLEPLDTISSRRKPPVEEKELQSLNKKMTRQKPSVAKIEPEAQSAGTRSTRRKPQAEDKEPQLQAAKSRSSRRKPRLSLVVSKLPKTPKPKPARKIAKSITIEVTEGRPRRARQTILNVISDVDNQTKTRKSAQQKTAKQTTQEDHNKDIEPTNAGKRKRGLNIRSKTIEKTEDANKRGRGKVEKQKQVEIEEHLPNKRSRKVANGTDTSRETKTRARRTNNKPVENTTKHNGKKNVKFTEASASPPAPSRSRRGTKANDKDSQEQVKSRKTEKSEEVAPTRGRKAAATAAGESIRGRKRKIPNEVSETQDVAEVKKPRATRARAVAQTENVEEVGSEPAGKEPTRRTRSRRC